METELIQEKEQVMKFKVGDRVNFTHNGDTYEGLIRAIEDRPRSNLPYHVEIIPGNNYCWVAEYDIQNLIQPEAAKEPVPGKFYRTRSGDKYFYVGKSKNGRFIYEFEEERYISYTNPFICSLNTTNVNDIVGEWTEETKLPSLEIKRWAVVSSSINNKIHKRGTIVTIQSDRQYIKDAYGKEITSGEVEIVELTGTLPERKASL